MSHQEVLSFISIKSFREAGNPTYSGQPPSPPGIGGGAALPPPSPAPLRAAPTTGREGGRPPPPSPRSVRGCREPAERQIPFVIKLSKSHFEGSARALQINRLLGLIAARRGLEVGAREQPHASNKGWAWGCPCTPSSSVLRRGGRWDAQPDPQVTPRGYINPQGGCLLHEAVPHGLGFVFRALKHSCGGHLGHASHYGTINERINYGAVLLATSLYWVGRTISSGGGGGGPEGLSPLASCYGLQEKQVHVCLQLNQRMALTLTSIPTVAMSLSCSLANFSRIHCQEEEKEKTRYFFLKKKDPKTKCKSW